MRLTSQQIQRRARKIKLLLMDVDGVMTDAGIYFLPMPDGKMIETKRFDSRDGLGLRFAHRVGLKTGIISGRGSPTVEQRVRDLGIHFLVQNTIEKLEPFERILRQAELKPEEVAYVGDDLSDIVLLKRVGLAVAVKNADPLLRRYVHYQTRAPGGFGAIREVIEIILKAQGKWQPLVEHYTR